jgi:hypothetical protein
MYDEFERAVMRPSRKRFSPLGWLAVGLITVLAVGVGGSMWAYHTVRDHLREFSHGVPAEPVIRLSEALAATVVGAFGGLGPIGAQDPSVRREILDHLQTAGLDRAAVQELIEGSLRIHGQDGDITADLHGDEDGGRLLIQSPEGEVRLDLVRGKQGGQLTVRTEEETLRFGAGGSAHDLPEWIPRVNGVPDRAREVFSASSDRGHFGIVTWEVDADPAELTASYRRQLEAAGFEVRAEHNLRQEDGHTTSVTGVHETTDRIVFLTTGREDGVTRAVLGYGRGDTQ